MPAIMNRALALAAVLAAGPALAQPCTPVWLNPTPAGDVYTPAQPGSTPPGEIYASVVFNDGTGPALYVGGWFRIAGGQSIQGVAKWSGTSWSRLGAGLGVPSFGSGSGVRALAVYDEGDGPALYIGGTPFVVAGGVYTVARWNGSFLEGIAPAEPGSPIVDALAAFDDGHGPGLVAGGRFGSIGPVAAANLAMWRHGRWEGIGGGIAGGDLAYPAVQALAVGPQPGAPLVVGGAFSSAGGTLISSLASWDGSAWHDVGGGVSGSASGQPAQVTSLEYSAVGGSTGLFVGGFFSMAGTTAAEKLARWDGAAWSAIPVRAGGSIRALRAVQESSGPALYVAGNFGPGNLPAAGLARWNGSSWSAPSAGLSYQTSSGEAWATVPWTDPVGPAIYVGGKFDHAGGLTTNAIARWSGTSWSVLGEAPNQAVRAAATYRDAVYLCGEFQTAGGLPGTMGVVRRVGDHFEAVGGGLNGPAYSAVVWDDGRGGGPALYVGGLFSAAGGVPARNIAKWDGSTWSALAGGIPGSGAWSGQVSALAVYNDGTGESLYAGGKFLASSGAPDNCIGRWDGAAWHPVGGGFQGTNSVYALAVFDDGGGPKLWAGTEYNNAPVPVSLAAWDGSAWSRPVGTPAHTIRTLTAFDDGQGPALYFGGLTYTTSPALGRVRGGTILYDLGYPFASSGTTAAIERLAVADDGTGPALYVGGVFNPLQGGVNVVKRSGSVWAPMLGVQNGAGGPVYAIAQGPGRQVVIGGDFQQAGGLSAGRWALWGCRGCYANCDGSIAAPILNVNDFVCFLGRYLAGDAYANCDGSTTPPVLNVSDFVCFLNRFTAGCP